MCECCRIVDILFSNGADNGTRTRGLNLGKVALYQLSYVRKQVNTLYHFHKKCKLGMSQALQVLAALVRLTCFRFLVF